MPKPKKITGYEAVCQPWVESERGWGISDDGYSLHLKTDDIAKFVKKYTKGWPDAVPEVYDRASGTPYNILVDKKTLDRITESSLGIRCYGYAPKPGTLLKDDYGTPSKAKHPKKKA